MSKEILSKTVSLTAIAVIVTVFASGCGGDDASGENGDTSASAPLKASDLTRSQFIAKAESFCKKTLTKAEGEYEKYLFAASAPTAKEKEEARAEVATTIFLPAFMAQVERIRSLGAPPGDQKQLGAVVSTMEEAIAEGEERPADLLIQLSSFFAATELAEGYGLKECARSFQVGA